MTIPLPAPTRSYSVHFQTDMFRIYCKHFPQVSNTYTELLLQYSLFFLCTYIFFKHTLYHTLNFLFPFMLLYYLLSDLTTEEVISLMHCSLFLQSLTRRHVLRGFAPWRVFMLPPSHSLPGDI